uniref:Uncharacterized protein n=1 Tax=Glossina palpalis gambiensis TaxID=67801 RepID=A0A1B0C6E0_9MUSC
MAKKPERLDILKTSSNTQNFIINETVIPAITCVNFQIFITVHIAAINVKEYRQIINLKITSNSENLIINDIVMPATTYDHIAAINVKETR